MQRLSTSPIPIGYVAAIGLFAVAICLMVSRSAFAVECHASNAIEEKTNVTHSNSSGSKKLQVEQLQQAWLRAKEQSRNVNNDEALRNARTEFIQTCESICGVCLPCWWRDRCLRELSFHCTQNGLTVKSTEHSQTYLPSDCSNKSLEPYRQLQDTIWVHVDTRDRSGREVKSLTSLLAILKPYPKAVEAFELFDRFGGVAVSGTENSKNKNNVFAVHSRLHIKTFPVFCIDRNGKMLWQTDVSGNVLSMAAGGGVMHAVSVLQSPQSYVLAGSDLIRIYLAEINPNTGKSVTLFGSRGDMTDPIADRESIAK